MNREEKDRRTAVLISAGAHALAFAVLAGGGLFSFLQDQSQPPPVDVTVYEAKAEPSAPSPSAGTGPASGGGGTFVMPENPLPAVSTAHTQAARRQDGARKAAASAASPKQDRAAANEAEKPSSETANTPQTAGTTGTANTAISGANHENSPSGGPVNAAGNSDSSGNGSGEADGGTGDANGGGHTDTGGGGGGPSSSPPADAAVPAQNPVPVYSPSAPYPQDLQNQHITGRAVVRVVVGSDGAVQSASLVESSGNSMLDSLAVETAQQWQFTPAVNRYGQPVACGVRLPFRFALH